MKRGKTNRSFFLLLFFFLASAFAGCNDDENVSPSGFTPYCNETGVLNVIGTNVRNDFLTTGEFLLTVLPEDNSGQPLLNDSFAYDVNFGKMAGPDIIQAAVTNEQLFWPLPASIGKSNIVKTHTFGADWVGDKSKQHAGIDIWASADTPVYAADNGIVTRTGFLGKDNQGKSWGNYVIVSHGPDQSWTTCYLHINSPLEVNNKVKMGDEIGTIFDRPGSHLHFSIRMAPVSDISPKGALPKDDGQSDPKFPEYFVDPHPDTSEYTYATSTNSVSGSAELERIIQPSGKPIAVVLDIDASGSMSSTDPNYLRKDGVKQFYNVLDFSGVTFTSALFEYNTYSSTTTPVAYTRMLHDFSSNVGSLNSAADNISAGGGTQTYESLNSLLDYLNSQKPADGSGNEPGAPEGYERSMILFSDGYPSSIALKNDVCAKANALNIPIHSIGLGPASDIDQKYNANAVKEMRDIADCTSGVYAGISATDDLSAIESVFNAIAKQTVNGGIVLRVKIDDVSNVKPGDIVSGNIILTQGSTRSSSPFSFRAP